MWGLGIKGLGDESMNNEPNSLTGQKIKKEDPFL
jgi:hypothetical protein